MHATQKPPGINTGNPLQHWVTAGFDQLHAGSGHVFGIAYQNLYNETEQMADTTSMHVSQHLVSYIASPHKISNHDNALINYRRAIMLLALF